ncbi:hypothetical protein [Flavihumibacter solisilvae]|uniref:Uncharacterized protein n=1 Tax=Flavihumibacter solisilvae TaxID=1349421 RepID=A0A0C1IJX6_9BACT|nr:hypothetical protein [Flavihumibacter solisilvae]KIC94480.1 hypothetical protein OI18_11430 [Flavihumibacter solisilvae]
MREFKLAKGWKIFIWLFSPLLIGLFAWLLIMPFVPGFENESPNNSHWFLMPLWLLMIGFFVFGLLEVSKAKFVIDTDRIYSVSALSTRELKFNEISGYRIADKYIIVEPNVAGKKRIKISTYLSNTAEICDWLAEKYPDLDVQAGDEEREEILSSDDYGFTLEEREQKLLAARRISKVINITAGITGLWLIFYPKPYFYLVIAAVAIPLVSLQVIKSFRGLIRVDERKDSAYPSLFWSILICSMSLVLRSVLDFNIYEYSNAWMLALTVSVIYLGVLLVRNKEFEFRSKSEIFTFVGVVLFIMSYSYGSVVTLNCLLDQSSPEAYSAEVKGKRVSSGKSTMYYLQLSRWGKQTEADEVTVSKEMYDATEISDPVTVYLMQGRFEIPWYEITTK